MDATSIRKGSFIMHKGGLWQVIDTTHRTPGNKRGFVQMKIKNMANGTHITEKFSSNEDVETAWLDARMSQYLYDDANTGPVFMDAETYEQFSLDRKILGDVMNYVKENDEVEVTFHEGNAIGVRAHSQQRLGSSGAWVLRIVRLVHDQQRQPEVLPLKILGQPQRPQRRIARECHPTLVEPCGQVIVPIVSEEQSRRQRVDHRQQYVRLQKTVKESLHGACQFIEV